MQIQMFSFSIAKKAFLVFCIICLGVSSAWAQVRTYSNEFLSLGVGARALAMGNAQNALSDDVMAAYWNPAGLTNVANTQLAAMHAEWFAGIAQYDYLAMAFPLAEKQTLALSVIRFGVDDIPNTLALVEADGTINYNNLSSFSAADYAFLVSYARAFSERLLFGANFKVIYRKVGSFANAWGFGLDAALQYKLSERLTLGANLKNVTTTYNSWKFNFTEEEKQQLAATDNLIPEKSVELTGQDFTIGAAYALIENDTWQLRSVLDLSLTFDGKRNNLLSSSVVNADPRLGVEAGYKNLVFLRLGINNVQKYTRDAAKSAQWNMQPNAGIGLVINKVSVDYALTGLNRVGTGVFSHVFSLKVTFGGGDEVYTPAF
ncbi:MAG: PorV/PorQ family protein [Chitinophagales bacterium]